MRLAALAVLAGGVMSVSTTVHATTEIYLAQTSLAIIRSATGLAAVPPHLDLNNWDRIKKGMSPKQVRAILGKAGQEVDSGMFIQWMYMAEFSGQQIPVAVVIFRNDEVMQSSAPTSNALEQLGIEFIDRGETGSSSDPPPVTSDDGPAESTTVTSPAEPEEPGFSLPDSPLVDGKPGWLFAERREMIQRGMSPDDVQTILGAPHTVQTHGDSGIPIAWNYGISNGVGSYEGSVSIRFRQNGDRTEVHGSRTYADDSYWEDVQILWGCRHEGWPAMFDPEHWGQIEQKMSPEEVVAIFGPPSRKDERQRWYYAIPLPGATWEATVGFADPEFPEVSYFGRPQTAEIRRAMKAVGDPAVAQAPQWAHDFIWRRWYHRINTQLEQQMHSPYGPNRFPAGDSETWDVAEGSYGKVWTRTRHYGDGHVTWRTDTPATVDQAHVPAGSGTPIDIQPPSRRSMQHAMLGPEATPSWRTFIDALDDSGEGRDSHEVITRNSPRVHVGQMLQQLGIEAPNLRIGTGTLKNPADRFPHSAVAWRDGARYHLWTGNYNVEGVIQIQLTFVSELQEPQGPNKNNQLGQQVMDGAPTWIMQARLSPPRNHRPPNWASSHVWVQANERWKHNLTNGGVTQPNLASVVSVFGPPERLSHTRETRNGRESWTVELHWGDGHVRWRTDLLTSQQTEPPAIEDLMFVSGRIVEIVPPSAERLREASGGAQMAMIKAANRKVDAEGRPRYLNLEIWEVLVDGQDNASWVRHILGDPTSIEFDERSGRMTWKYGPWQGAGERWNSGQFMITPEGQVYNERPPRRKD